MLQLGDIKQYRKRSQKQARNVGTAPGVASRDSKSTYVDPFFTTRDENNNPTVLHRNPWTEGNNRNPYRGAMINVTGPDGSTTKEPWYFTDAAKKAKLGTTGFSEISAQLEGLMGTFSENLSSTTETIYDRLGTLSTGSEDDRDSAPPAFKPRQRRGVSPETTNSRERRAQMNAQFS